MPTVPAPSRSATAVTFSETHLIIALPDGRQIATPLTWYPRLLAASPEDRHNVEVSPWGLYWPTIDEDLSFQGMLEGRPAVKGIVDQVS